MNEINQARLNEFLKTNKISQTELAEKLGTSQSSISAILSGKRNLTRGMVARMTEIYPELNLESTDNNVEASSSDRLIPFYDVETTGGYNGLVSSSDVEANLAGYIQAGGWFDGKETAAIRHVGDSMTEYPNGCILAVREVTERRLLVPGRNYVVETSEYRVTKRLQRGSSAETIALYSTNDDTYPDGRLIHEPFEVQLADVRRIYSVLGYIVNQSGEFRLIKP